MPSPKVPYFQTPVWPELQDSYIDEFGDIDIEIYEVARVMWPRVQPRILRMINNVEEGQRLMMKATAAVSQRKAAYPERMTNPKAYLLVTFSRLLLEEHKRQVRYEELDVTTDERVMRQPDPNYVDIDEVILIREILERADDWTREIYQYLIIGYTFEELAAARGLKANRLRSMWSKKMFKLKNQIEKEMRTAKRR